MSHALVSNRSSMRLEPEFWDSLHDIGVQEGCDIHTLIRRVDREPLCGRAHQRSAGFIPNHFRAAAEAGQQIAGHGRTVVPALSETIEGHTDFPVLQAGQP